MTILLRSVFLLAWLLPSLSFAASSTTMTNAAGAPGGSITVQEEGSDLTARSKINMIGSPITCVDNSGSSRTDCTVTSSAYSEGTAFPGSPSAGDKFIITDDSISGACDSAGGTSVTLCRYTGSAWQRLNNDGALKVVQGAIPFIKSSSGTMGNNGAISAMTALPRTYSGGVWLYLPAGAICTTCTASVGGGGAGNASAVGWYWFVGSSTTAGTVYNSNYTTGVPTLGTTTALTETGPGAYAGVTGAITSLSVTVPANSMGANGQVVFELLTANNSTAGTKLHTTQFGGSTCGAYSNTTVITSNARCIIANRANTAIQSVTVHLTNSNNVGLSVLGTDLTKDTTADQTVTLAMNCNTATDSTVLERYAVHVWPSN